MCICVLAHVCQGICMLWLTALVEVRRQFSPFIYILVIIKINFSHLHRLNYLCGCSNLKYFICIATEIRTHTMTSDLSVSTGAVGSSHSPLTPDPYPFKEQSPSLATITSFRCLRLASGKPGALILRLPHNPKWDCHTILATAARCALPE